MNTLPSVKVACDQLAADAQDTHHYLGSILESMDRLPRKARALGMDHAFLDDCRLLLGRVQMYDVAVQKFRQFSNVMFELEIITELQHDRAYWSAVDNIESEAELQKETTRLLLKFLAWCKLAGINSYEGHLL